MIITISDSAREHLKKLSSDNAFGLGIEDGCCGKAFALDISPKESTRRVEIDGVTFYVSDEAETLAPEVSIDAPGPVEGLMITNLKAIGGCACGRSFFVEE